MQKRQIKNSRRAILNNHLVDYPTPTNISYYQGFGSMSGLMLVVQLVTGIFRAMHYTPHVDRAFASVEHIMRDVNYGQRLRYMHANGASFFFIVLYRHIARGRYYGSYAHPRGHRQGSGVIIFRRTMGTGFMGYVLPWHLQFHQQVKVWYNSCREDSQQTMLQEIVSSLSTLQDHLLLQLELVYIW